MKQCVRCGADATAAVLMFESPLERDLVCVDHDACRARERACCKHCGSDGTGSLLFAAAAGPGVECWNRTTCRMRVIERALQAQPDGTLILRAFDGGALALLLAVGDRMTTLVASAPRPA